MSQLSLALSKEIESAIKSAVLIKAHSGTALLAPISSDEVKDFQQRMQTEQRVGLMQIGLNLVRPAVTIALREKGRSLTLEMDELLFRFLLGLEVSAALLRSWLPGTQALDADTIAPVARIFFAFVGYQSLKLGDNSKLISDRLYIPLVETAIIQFNQFTYDDKPAPLSELEIVCLTRCINYLTINTTTAVPSPKPKSVISYLSSALSSRAPPIGPLYPSRDLPATYHPAAVLVDSTTTPAGSTSDTISRALPARAIAADVIDTSPVSATTTTVQSRPTGSDSAPASNLGLIDPDIVELGADSDVLPDDTHLDAAPSTFSLEDEGTTSGQPSEINDDLHVLSDLANTSMESADFVADLLAVRDAEVMLTPSTSKRGLELEEEEEDEGEDRRKRVDVGLRE